MSSLFGPFSGIPEPSSGGPLDSWRVPVTRIRKGTAGVDSLKVPIPGAPSRTALPPALFEQVENASLRAAGVDATTAEPNVYWPGEWPDVRSGDSLEIDGVVWLVDERPVKSPLGLRVALNGVQPKGAT